MKDDSNRSLRHVGRKAGGTEDRTVVVDSSAFSPTPRRSRPNRPAALRPISRAAAAAAPRPRAAAVRQTVQP